jgi:hypothetical protein
MRLIDDSGKLLGRINAVDAAVAGVVLLLVPVAYAAYLLFRTPDPVIHPIAPTTITGTAVFLYDGARFSTSITVTGEHLVPYLRAVVSSAEAIFLFESSERAVVHIPYMPVGTYDLTFFDEAFEIARYEDLISFEEPPEPEVEVWLEGAFTGLTPSQVEEFFLDESVAGSLIEGWASEVMGLGDPEPDLTTLGRAIPGILGDKLRVPAVLRAQRDMLRVPAVLRAQVEIWDEGMRLLNGTSLASMPAPVRASDPSSGPTSEDWTFVVQRVRPSSTQPVVATARVMTRPEIVQKMRETLTRPASPQALADLETRLLSIEVQAQATGTTPSDIRLGPMTILHVTFQVPAVNTPEGWLYHGGEILKPGATWVPDTRDFRVSSEILAVEIIE